MAIVNLYLIPTKHGLTLNFHFSQIKRKTKINSKNDINVSRAHINFWSPNCVVLG